MKTTAFMFPGLNALLRRGDRNQFLNLPEVQSRFSQAEAALQNRLGLKVLFNDILQGSTEQIYAVENISLAAVIICSIQTGVADRIIKRLGAPEWVIGCSLGDIARSVTAGAYDFEDAIINHVVFTRSIEGIDKIGGNIGVAAPASAPFTTEDFKWFDLVCVDVSILTPRFLNIGGRFEDLKLIEAKAQEKRWHIMPILKYPAHSRYILPYVQKVEDRFDTVKIRAPSIRIFSSFSCQELVNPQVMAKEFLHSISQTIHWLEAVNALVQNHGVTKFINIGPCRSLSRMMKDICPVETVEASALTA